jgi:putative ABC transport system permease protein
MLYDLYFAQRSLRRSPATTAILILTLALGVGANTAIVTMTSAVLWRQLPFRDPQSLVSVWSKRTDRDKAPLSIADALDFRASTAVRDLAVYAPMGGNLTGAAEPERLEGLLASPNLFDLLGAQPALGNLLTHGDPPRTIVLSHALWQRDFGGASEILARTVSLNGQAYSVAGILPREFPLPVCVDFVVPMNPETDARRLDRGDHYLTGLARLQPGISPAAAERELTAAARRLQSAYPATNLKNSGARALPLAEEVVGDFGPSLRLLTGAAAVLLLLVCSSLASLSLARIAARAHEFAIRTSLGAARWRLARQVCAEMLLVAFLGGIAALAVGYGGLELLKSLSPPGLPRLAEVRIDVARLAGNMALAIVTGFVLGLTGALAVSRTQPADALKSGARPTGAGGLRMRTMLSGVQLALAVVLLTGAGLLIRGFARLQSVEPGYAASDALVLRVALMPPPFPDTQSIATFYDGLRAGLRRIAGVEAAGAVSNLPLSGLLARADFIIDGHPPAKPEETPSANFRVIGPGYFAAMHTPIIAGRDFADTDTARAQPVAIVSRELARRFAVGSGTHLRISGFGAGEAEIAGIVGDIHQTALTDPPSMDLYLPYTQAPRGALGILRNNMFWVIRARNAAGIEQAARRAVHDTQRDVAVSSAMPLAAYLDRSIAPRRFNLVLLGIFAVSALLLAAISVYGVMAHSVTLRSRELGLRMALGAQRSDVLFLVVRQGLLLTSYGLMAGVALAAALTRWLSAILFKTPPLDVATFAAVAVVLFLAGLAASGVPALRANRAQM